MKRKANSNRPIEILKTTETVRIGELSDLTGIKITTLKFYTKNGLLKYHQIDTKSNRLFNRKETLKRVAEIQKYKDAGMSIEDIKKKFPING